jgi:4'-phosphopantetheinyl transferase
VEFLAAPERLDPPGAEVHVWRADLDRPDWPDAEGLPEGERSRASSILRPQSQRRWVAARWVLRETLSRYLGEAPAEIRFELGEHGKPRLAAPSAGLTFNLSHSGDVALVAVAAGREVGVDVERVSPERDPLRLAERALGPEGAALVRAAPAEARAELFHRLWADREARLKCLGVGVFASPPPGAADLRLERLDLGPQHAASVAVGAGPLELRCLALEPTAPMSRDLG